MSTINLVSTFVPSPSTTRGVSTKLSASKDGSKLAYGSGRNAIILSLSTSTPLQPIIFPHSHPVTVVSISPSGYYAASGDSSGQVKIWSLDSPVGQSPSIKFESKVLNGKVNDICWDGESKRFLVVGEGRDKFGAAFSFETGASIGEIVGHSKPINSVSMRSSRPFKAITASDDSNVCFHTGVPFKFESKSQHHSRFVQSVSYSSNDQFFVSGGSDGKLFLYEGLKGEMLAEFKDGEPAAHKGTIFAATWSNDSKTVVTSSADGTVKLWNVENRSLLHTWKIEAEGSSSIDNQQVGNCFAGKQIVTLSFSGNLNIFEPGSSVRTIHGHQTSITTLAQSTSGQFYTGDASGCIRQYTNDGECTPVVGSGHASRIVSIVPLEGGTIATTSYDDNIRFIEDGKGFSGASISTGSLPKALSASSNILFLATAKSLQSFNSQSQTLISTLPINYSATSIDSNKIGSIIAVGAEDSKVYMYEYSTREGFKLLGKCELRNPVTTLAFNLDGKSLAVGESTGKILLFDVETREVLISSSWVYQSARIQSLAWHPNGNHIASGSLDTSIFIYSTSKPSEVISVKNVHSGGVSQIAFSNDDELISTGADASIKRFQVKLVV